MTFSIPEPQSQPTPARAVTGRKALWVLLGFFGVILAVNATFVYLAVSSFSGLETDNAYVKGLNYNTTLSRAAEHCGITLAEAEGQAHRQQEPSSGDADGPLVVETRSQDAECARSS